MKRGEDKYGHAIGAVFDLPDGRRITGYITLKRGELFESIAKICDDEFFLVPNGSSLRGISEEGKVSLLDCWNGHPASTRWPQFKIHHCDLSFTYALFGNRHLKAEEEVITGMRFTFDEIDEILSNKGLGTFGHILNPNQEIIDAIEQNKPDYLKGDLRMDGSAMVSYFTGDYEILPRMETVLGTIGSFRVLSADHSGRNMKDEPYITLDFDHEPATLVAAFEKMRAVRQFFAWMIGYAPRWKNIRVFTSELNDPPYRVDADGHPDSGLEVFAPIEWRIADYDRDHIASWDVLIDASREPDHFADVMRKWLERNNDESRKRSNARFYGSLRGMSGRDLADNIVSAANTFDLMPSSDKPATPLISEEIKTILDHTKKIIKELDTEEKENVLNQLGRIGSYVNLRPTVEARASITLDSMGRARLPNLDKVIRDAVRCRHYYTHGGDSKDTPKFSDPSVVVFLMDTLQFIYGVSELLSCGWDIDNWRERMHMSHPFSVYIQNYEWQLKRTGLSESENLAT